MVPFISSPTTGASSTLFSFVLGISLTIACSSLYIIWGGLAPSASSFLFYPSSQLASSACLPYLREWHQNIWINSIGGGRREARAELRSLGHQRVAPQWWHDSENRATIEGWLFGGQGSRALLPPPLTIRINITFCNAPEPKCREGVKNVTPPMMLRRC